MLGLLAINALIIVWKRAIRISDKLKPATWEVLAISQAALFVLSIWGLQELQKPQKMIPLNSGYCVSHIDHVALIDGSNSLPVYSDMFEDAPWAISPYTWGPSWVDYPATQTTVFLWNAQSVQFYAPGLAPGSPGIEFPNLDRFFDRKPTVVVQLSSPEEGGLKKTLLFLAYLFGTLGAIVTPFMGLAAITFGWIRLHRTRREAILMLLEIEKRKLEIEQLRLELERSRQNPPSPPPSLIIIP
jgi:hypothetical protein